MNVVSSTVLRNSLADTLRLVEKKKEYVLVTDRGKPRTAIINIDLLEDLLALGNKKYLDEIREAREDYKKGKVYTFEEVFGKI